MWYLIKSSATGKFSIRYYSSINDSPSMLFTNSAYILWVLDINRLSNLIEPSSHYPGPSLKELYNRTGYLIKPLPEIPINIPSISIIKSFYPELFL